MKWLNRVIKKYTNGEVNLGGLKVLGILVGLSEFTRKELSEFEISLATDTCELLKRFPDLQTVG